MRGHPKRPGLARASRRHPRLRLLALFALAVSCDAADLAASRLSAATVERLDNGLTVMVLEDPALPLVSTQVLYKVGGRTECTGETGLAHFVEHMAFRATSSFPATDVVSRIYAVGGEWHGYTWIDQTTYFETVPAGHLDLVLRIQADRMARLLLPAAEIEAERGAVLTELHGYENDPALVLHDAVVAASFAEHPYRQNVIGWTSDVQRITHADVAAFYRRHYVPANAVLAVAGDVRTADVLALVRRHFGALPAGEPTPPPHTVEPPQRGERRLELQGAGAQSRFEIAYRAPAATDPDFAAFLLLRALLSGSSGASFRQDGDFFAARPGSRLHGAAEEIASFFAPTAQPYVLSISGKTAPEVAPGEIEKTVEEQIALLRDRPVPSEELERMRRDFLAELVLDEETTEDAAHQMAFYEGIGAFPVLLRLADLVAAVTPEDIRRAAASRLQPWQRTIGWYHAGAPVPGPPVVSETPPKTEKTATSVPAEAARSAPRVKVLPNGIALIVRRIARVPAGHLRAVVAGNALAFGPDATPDEPAWRHTSVSARFRAGELRRAAAELRQTLATARPEPPPDGDKSEDPGERLAAELRELLDIEPLAGDATPVVVAAVGDLDETEALAILEKTFSDLPARKLVPPARLHVKKREERIPLPGKAQSQLGYAVPAPPPADPASLAWRLLLYVMTHDYEGRLGKELIARRGLLYHIGSRYHSDGQASWISMTAGVNPENLEESRRLFGKMLDGLRDDPPTEAEIEEAKQHLLGRRITAPMSNQEMSAFHAQEWIEQGRLLTDEEWTRRVREVKRDQVIAIVPDFLAGTTAVVDTALRPARSQAD